MNKLFATILSLTIILVVILTYHLSSPNDKVLLESINQDLNTIAKAVNQYYDRFGSFPSNTEGINRLVEVKLLEKFPISPWGHNYAYLLSDNKSHVTIISYGRDNKVGGSGLDMDRSKTIHRKDVK